MRGIMDQTPQPPTPPTEPETPAPQAPPAPQPPTPPSAPGMPNSVMSPAPSSNKGLIIGLIAGGVVLLLVVLGIVLAVTLGSKNNNNNVGDTKKQDSNSQGSSSDDSLRAANAETATSLSSFDAVCENGSISNAADFNKPYKVAAFAKNSTQRSYITVSLPYNADYAGKYGEHEKVNVVACLNEKAGTAVKSKTCDFKSGKETVSLDYYAVKYTLSLREAKTGKLIKDLEEVNGPATTCPMFASYSKTDPKLHASPDRDAVDVAVKKFIAE